MKKNKLPSFITVLILTLITVVMWVSFSVFRALSSKPVASVPEEVSKPLNPTLDSDTIGKIRSRIFLDDSQIPENIITAPTPGPTPTPVATPRASPSPTASPEESATPTPEEVIPEEL